MTDKPHIGIITEFAKATIGIVALLLGFSVTFLSTDNASHIIGYAGVNWGTGILCVISSLIVLTKLVNLSQGRGSENSAILFSNIAFFLLLLHLISFVLLGYARFSVPTKDEKVASNGTMSVSCMEVVGTASNFVGKQCKVELGKSR